MVNLENICGKYMHRVLLEVSKGRSSFKELMSALSGERPSISTTTLSERLKGLEKEGLVKRELIASRPPRSNYTITGKGREVLRLLNELERL
jgi:DNA-binding HxlR family transcriptional regulator